MSPALLSAAIALVLLLAGGAAAAGESGDGPVAIGSKTFGENYILAEIVAGLLEARGVAVERRLGLGGTLIAWEALRSGEVDIYPEYTGTLRRAVLRQPDLTADELRSVIGEQGVHMPVRLGFENSYAIAVDGNFARNRGLETISDLREHPELVVAFSLEFLNRGDGWPALREHYALPQVPVGIEHALAYRAIAAGEMQVTDAYTTDGELDAFDLVLLRDDRQFFPAYDAVLVARTDLPEGVLAALAELEDSLDEPAMRALNRLVANEGLSPAAAAARFLGQRGLATSAHEADSLAARIAANTAVHLKLTGTALLLACLVALPLGLLCCRRPPLARGLLYVTGLLQTIPALALLALLVPVMGLGQPTAIIALFLYSLLPVARNTVTGMVGVDPLLLQVATGLGLTPRQRLWQIELPLAMPTILAGIKTAAIISIGTATLAAFVGAGGLGEPIITGLSLNDMRLVLEGALPAAGLAILVELLFELLERVWLPAHLRQ